MFGVYIAVGHRVPGPQERLCKAEFPGIVLSQVGKDQEFLQNNQSQALVGL